MDVAEKAGILGKYEDGAVTKYPTLSNGHIHVGPKNVFDRDHPLIRTRDFILTSIVDLRTLFHCEQWLPHNVTNNPDGTGGERQFGKSIKGVFDADNDKTKRKRCALPCPCGGFSHFSHVKRMCWRMAYCEISDFYPQGDAVVLGWMAECQDCKKAGKPYCFRSFNANSIDWLGKYSKAVKRILFNWVITPGWIVSRRLMMDVRIHRDNGIAFKCIARMRDELKVEGYHETSRGFVCATGDCYGYTAWLHRP